MAQPFNWVAESISPNNNLQQMHLYDDNSAVITGLSNTFSKYDPTAKSWSPIKIVTPTYDFISLSIKNGNGLLSSRRAKMIDNPTGGNEDLYANGLFLKTTDNGATWTNFDLSALDNIALDTLNPSAAGSLAMDIYATEYIDDNNILLYSGWYDYRDVDDPKNSRGAVFATTDGGTTWEAITGDLGSAVITAIKNNGTYSVFGGLNQLFKHVTGETVSTDLYPALSTGAGGDATIYVNDFTIVDENTFYVTTTGNGILLTTDAGVTFTPVSGAPNAADLYVHNANVMIGLGSSTQSKVTINGGTTWTTCYPGSTIWEIGGVFNGYLYALAKSSVYKLSVADLEAGVSNWTSVLISLDNNLHQMHIADDNTAFIAGYGQTMVRSTNGGTTWVDVACPDPILPLAEELDFGTLAVSGNLSIAAARRFKLIDYPTTSSLVDLTEDGVLFTSTDNWETWSVLDITKIGELASADASLNPTLEVCYGVDPYRLAITNSTTYYVWVNWYEVVSETVKNTHSRIFKSTDSGATWTSISDDFGSSFVYSINFLNESFGIVTGNNSILLKTIDGGANFINLSPIILVGTDGSLIINGSFIVDENEFYIYTGSDGIFKTTDGGDSFTKFPVVSGTSDFIKLNNSTFMALGSSTKSYYSNTGGESWVNCYPGSSIWKIGEIMNDSLYALAKGNVYKIAMAEIVSTVGIEQLEKANEISVRYFSESIQLVSAQNEIDQCILYNITGEIMATYTPKSVLCTIDTGNLPTGIYIAATVSNGKRFTNKLYIK